MRKKLLIANWKMNGLLAQVEEWVPEIVKAGEHTNAEFVLCPPVIYIPRVAELANSSKLAWGAQDISDKEQGAFTGQISAAMLKEFNCRYSLVGHSERRHFQHETDHLIAEKFTTAQAHNIIPVLCIGETQKEYEANKTEEVVLRQLNAVIKHAGINSFSSAVIAYEPVWAIGSGLAATPQQAQMVHEMIRLNLAEQDLHVAAQVRILYGGSVKPENASELFMQADIDGGLVGGASLDAKTFIEISKGLLI